MDAKGATHSLNLTRRGMLRNALVVAGGGCLLAAGALPAQAAAAKMAQKLANYRPTPFGKSQCNGCAQWQAPNACKLVEGPISPTGWCSLYAPKPK